MALTLFAFAHLGCEWEAHHRVDPAAQAKLAAVNGHLWKVQDTDFVAEHSVTQSFRQFYAANERRTHPSSRAVAICVIHPCFVMYVRAIPSVVFLFHFIPHWNGKMVRVVRN